MVGQRWTDLPDPDRQYYLDKAVKDKERYAEVNLCFAFYTSYLIYIYYILIYLFKELALNYAQKSLTYHAQAGEVLVDRPVTAYNLFVRQVIIITS